MVSSRAYRMRCGVRKKSGTRYLLGMMIINLYTQKPKIVVVFCRDGFWRFTSLL